MPESLEERVSALEFKYGINAQHIEDKLGSIEEKLLTLLEGKGAMCIAQSNYIQRLDERLTEVDRTLRLKADKDLVDVLAEKHAKEVVAEAIEKAKVDEVKEFEELISSRKEIVLGLEKRINNLYSVIVVLTVGLVASIITHFVLTAPK
jgi:hypothetical protein